MLPGAVASAGRTSIRIVASQVITSLPGPCGSVARPERDVEVVVSNSISYRNTCPGENRGARETRGEAIFPPWSGLPAESGGTFFCAEAPKDSPATTTRTTAAFITGSLQPGKLLSRIGTLR